MKLNDLVFKFNTSKYQDIFTNLIKCDKSFIPRLSSYVVIEDYSKKLFEKAERFEVWYYKELVGFIAFYINKEENYLYITNASVLTDFQGNSLITTLFKEVVGFCTKNKLHKIKIEVFEINTKAVALYKYLGFAIVGNKNAKCLMEFKLKLKEQ